MLFLCYPKCTTCKKAQAWLDGQGLTYDLRDIKTDNPTVEEQNSAGRAGGCAARGRRRR